MTDRARLYAQLAFVALSDADEAASPTPDHSGCRAAPDLGESARLLGIGDELFERALALGFDGGTDAAFGEDLSMVWRPRRRGAHVRVQLWMGSVPGLYALAGEVVMTREEWSVFAERQTWADAKVEELKEEAQGEHVSDR